MSNLFIHDIVGQNDFAVPASDAALGTATTELDALISTVALLTYDRIVAWVESADGAGAPRTLNCLVEKLEYNSEECPDATEVQTLTASIEATLEADVDITSIGTQDVHIFQAGNYFHWLRDTSSGFVYPAITTDDVAVGGHLSPQGKWFQDGDLVLGDDVMSGAERLRVIGSERLEGGLLMLERASVTSPAAGEAVWWVENATPSLPKFTDDGPNTSTLLYGGAQLSLLGIDQILIVDKTSESYTPDGSQQEPYNSINAAITAATALTPSSSNRILILIYPGVYTEAVSTADSYVYFAGLDRNTTIIRQSSGTSAPLTILDGNVGFKNLTFECTASSTARIVACSTNLAVAPVVFENCAFLGNGSVSTNNYVYFSSLCSIGVDFHECCFENVDPAQYCYWITATPQNDQRFFSCDFRGIFREQAVSNLSTCECYACDFTTTAAATNMGAVRIDYLRTLGHQFFGCRFVNTSTTGNAVFGPLGNDKFTNCHFFGGSSGYDVRYTNASRLVAKGCFFERGLYYYVIPDDDRMYVASGPQRVPYHQSLDDCIRSANANTASTDLIVTLLEDQTLAAQLTSLSSGREMIIDGLGLYAIDRAGLRVIQLSNVNVPIRFKRVEVKGEIYMTAAGAEAYFERSRLDGRVYLQNTGVLRAHDSAFVGDSTYTSVLEIQSATCEAYYSGCYLKGHTGNAAVNYGIDGTSTTYDMDALYMERTVCMHGSLGTNNPFSGEGQGGSPPVNIYYALDCTFNEEPAIADPTYLVNNIDSGQRKNTIDPDGDWTWMPGW